MHVVYLPSWYPPHKNSGTGSFFREQAIAMHEAGHKVGVVYIEGRPLTSGMRAFKGSALRETYDDGIITIVSSVPEILPRIPFGNSSVLAAKWVQAFAAYVRKHGRPDLIHAHSAIYAGEAARWIATRYKIPYILTEHRSALMAGQIKPWQKKLLGKIAQAARVRMAVSRASCDALEQLLGARHGSWECSYNLIADQFFEAPIPLTRSRPFTFVSVSYHVYRKRVDLIIDAFLSNQSLLPPQSELWIVGGGDETAALKRAAEGNNAIKFLGELSRLDTVQALYKSDCLVHAARNEPFGVVIGEALALGKPVVTTDCGGPPEMVDEASGVVVPVDDAAALGAAMVEVARYHQHYDPLAIRTRANDKLGRQAFVQRMTTTYEEATF